MVGTFNTSDDGRSRRDSTESARRLTALAVSCFVLYFRADHRVVLPINAGVSFFSALSFPILHLVSETTTSLSPPRLTQGSRDSSCNEAEQSPLFSCDRIPICAGQNAVPRPPVSMICPTRRTIHQRQNVAWLPVPAIHAAM